MKKKRNYVLVYESAADPAPAEVDRTMTNLSGLEAEEVVPGTIKIVGDPAQVEQAAAAIDGWSLAAEEQLSDKRPHHRSAKR